MFDQFNELRGIVQLGENASLGFLFARRFEAWQIDTSDYRKKWLRLCQGCERLSFETEEATVPPYFKIIDVYYVDIRCGHTP